ncbi:Zn(2)-C6 fungal-type domain-containing protein [Mycena sanguinolenta]|uniref:Zn(2)-C6 fungal-type domain-containing protein n=1 Tax=Mycena sanguinolenta TaxID=230812 RepID=A0A8H7CUQ4_9AGAR|nr:Zn(2)-C6 fungal-type domain-containing protein [Mycena sanguinolenta]
MKRIKEKVHKTFRRFSQVQPSLAAVVAPPMVREVIAGDPFLPPELEREIFELVAANDPLDIWTHQHVGVTVLALPQVCRRVQSWIEPIIYERISLLHSFNGGEPVPKFLATINARPASFFAAHVKYLYFDRYIPLPAIQQVLSVCTGAVSVGCHHPYLTLAPLLAPLPLHRLCVSEFVVPSKSADLPPWAASLTQLGLTNVLPPDPMAAFATLPSLTHLAVGYDALPNPDNPGAGAALLHLLRAAPRLCCLVLLTESKTDYKWAHQRLREDGFADARFYVHLRPIPDGTWDAWSRRVPDVFVEAEEAMERRRAVAAAKAGMESLPWRNKPGSTSASHLQP